ncbi:MAG: CDC48 family AAA ATPase [Candidatus Thermoplasmatota archaeon]|nr:CDC48 family AAA ATPase [Candidatus Thermoplasmatota archaeon]
MSRKIEIKVEPTLKNDVGFMRARLSTKSRENLEVSPGDIISIKGKKETAAVVWRAPIQDENKSIIRIDGITRKNADASIGDRVVIKKVDPKPAEKINISPAIKEVPHLQFANGIDNFIKKSLLKRPVHTGDTLIIQGIALMGSQLPFVVASTKPKGVVQITVDTEIKISKENIQEDFISRVAYEDIGGLRDELKRVREIIELPLKHQELFDRLGIEPPKGVLLHGPPGTGKTLIAKAVATESGASFYSIQGPEIMNKYYGQTEENLRKKFQEAEENLPAIIFIDEIDSIAPKRDEVKGEVERRVVAQLLTLMDGLEEKGRLIVIAATNRVNHIDAALRRPGRFDREIEIGVPDISSRIEILQVHTRAMPLSKDVDLESLADLTHGFVGADLASLAREGAMKSLRRYLPDIDLDRPITTTMLESLEVEMNDFKDALKEIEPSTMREVFIEVPKVKWEQIGGLEEVKQKLRETVEWPLTDPEAFIRIGVKAPSGVLLYGPPGTGKTLMAKAIATETNANFISIKGPEVLSKWVGDSEKAVREIFKKARQVAPCIIFLDEIDALAPTRSSATQSHVSERLVNQLLTSMDGIEDTEGVIVIGATNRPDILDQALLRSGRFDRMIFVGPPELEERKNIFKVHTKNMPLDRNVIIDELAERTEGYTGADIEGICREAGIIALRKDMGTKKVSLNDFEESMKDARPSVDQDTVSAYKRIMEQWKGGINKKEKDDKGLNFYG